LNYEGEITKSTCVSIRAAAIAENDLSRARNAGAIAQKISCCALGAGYVREADIAANIDLRASLTGDVEGIADQIVAWFAGCAELIIGA
jgi:hypothetical protein